jgi:hypothetical protein
MGGTIKGIAGLARYLKVEERWAWRLYAAGYFRGFDPGTGELYFRVEDVEEGLRRLREELARAREGKLGSADPQRVQSRSGSKRP